MEWMNEYEEQVKRYWWGENQSNRRKTCPTATVYHKSHMGWPKIELGPPQGKVGD